MAGGGGAGFAFQAAGAIASAVGAFYDAKMRKRQLQFDARIADINANYAEQAAQFARARGDAKKQASQLAYAQLKGKQRTALAANGIDMSSDTAGRILATTDLADEVGALAIDQDTLEDVWNRRRDASNLRAQAGASRASADGTSPFGSMIGSLLGSSGQVAQSWYSWKGASK